MIYCRLIGQGNKDGKENTVACLHKNGIFVWCQHCQRMHNISKDQCLRAWEQLRVQEEERTKKR